MSDEKGLISRRVFIYRLMVKDEMRRAVDACAKAGIGLTAMKTQAAFSANFYASIGSETDDA